MNEIQSLLLILGIITGFVFIVTFTSVYVSDVLINQNACGCVIPIPLMLVILSSLGLFVGFITSFVFTKKINKETQDMIKEKKILRIIFLKQFDQEERKVIEYLIQNKGNTTQSEISKLLNDRVKAYRIIKKLDKRGIIKIKNNNNSNKTNLISLTEEIYNLLK